MTRLILSVILCLYYHFTTKYSDYQKCAIFILIFQLETFYSKRNQFYGMDCRYRQEMVQARQQEIMAAKRQEIAEARATARAQANMMNMNADAVNLMNQPIGSSVGNMMADLIKMQAQALARSAQFQQSTGLYKKCPKFSIFAVYLTSIDSFYLVSFF